MLTLLHLIPCHALNQLTLDLLQRLWLWSLWQSASDVVAFLWLHANQKVLTCRVLEHTMNLVTLTLNLNICKYQECVYIILWMFLVSQIQGAYNFPSPLTGIPLPLKLAKYYDITLKRQIYAWDLFTCMWTMWVKHRSCKFALHKFYHAIQYN